MPGDESLTFLHYFSGPAKFVLGEGISATPARRGVKVGVINRDILRDGADLLADEPFSSDFAAALNGHFDGVSIRASLVPPSAASGFRRAARLQSGTVSTCKDVRRTVECSSSKRRNAVGGYGTCDPVRGKEAGTALHGDARESSGSWCRPVPECLVVTRTCQYHRRTRRRASSPQHLMLWSASLEGAVLGRLPSRPRGTREKVLLQGPARAPGHQSCH